MPISSFHEMLLPLLRRSADGRDRTVAVPRAPLADDFALADAERQELLPSNTQSRFVNRPSSAKIYLERAELITRVRRNAVISTGKKYASHPPAHLNRLSALLAHTWRSSYSTRNGVYICRVTC